MGDEQGYGVLPLQSVKLESPTEIVPTMHINQELLNIEAPPHQPIKSDFPTVILPIIEGKGELLNIKPFPCQPLENPVSILPAIKMKEELLDMEDSQYEQLKLESPSAILPIIVKIEDLLDIKVEPDILDDLVVSVDGTDECDTDNKDITLRDRSGEDLMSLCEEETVGNNTVLYNTASSEPGVPLSVNVKYSSLPDCKLPSVQQYSRNTFKKKVNKKRKTSTIQSTEFKMRRQEYIETNRPDLQYKLLNTKEPTLTCNEGKPNVCDTCPKFGSTPSTFKKHMEILAGSRAYTCDTCHKSFSSLSSLKTHKRIHTGIKPYTCDTCHKCFSWSSSLKSHITIHTGSKPFTCDTCHKSFRSLSSLKSHKRIHTGLKPFTCDTCHKCFRGLYSLKAHIIIHSGSKPYICDTCHRCLRTLDSLKIHRLLRHREQTIHL